MNYQKLFELTPFSREQEVSVSPESTPFTIRLTEALKALSIVFKNSYENKILKSKDSFIKLQGSGKLPGVKDIQYIEGKVTGLKFSGEELSTEIVRKIRARMKAIISDAIDSFLSASRTLENQSTCFRTYKTVGKDPDIHVSIKEDSKEGSKVGGFWISFSESIEESVSQAVFTVGVSMGHPIDFSDKFNKSINIVWQNRGLKLSRRIQ